MITRKSARGFTLIELMVTVAIVGMLSSVALPMYKKATLRARSAERGTMLQSIRVAIEDAFVRNKIPADGLLGDANPPLPLSVSKRSFVHSMAGWVDLSLVVQGECYYSYGFRAAESTAGAGAGAGTNATYEYGAMGDLDGDGQPSTKHIMMVRTNGVWTLNGPDGEDPKPGDEDLTTF